MYMKFQGPFPVCLLMLYSFALKSEKSQLYINRAGRDEFMCREAGYRTETL